MTTLTFYKGLRVIGGTFIAVETPGAICMFDFGFTVNDTADDRVRVRPGEIPADTVRSGRLPAADGIYAPDTAATLGCTPYGATEKPTFFLISHMHIDHMGGLDMLDPRVPVYMSADSLALYRRLCAQGDITFREHENCIGIPYGERFLFEDLEIEVLAIDHDCTGAAGFLIHTPDGNICYTGDYRFHGWHPERSEAFARHCAGADLLITEGVTVSHADVDMKALTGPAPGARTEPMLLQETVEFCRSEKKLVVINPYNRNVERIYRLSLAIAETGRQLVLDCTQADYLHAFYPDAALLVYTETVHGRPLPAGATMVDRAALLAHPERYVLQLDYADLYELFDLAGAAGCYLHMDGWPLGSYDPSYPRLRHQLEALGIPYHFMSLGGHAHPYWLRWMVDTIAPYTLVPLHSHRPEQVDSDHVGQRILPQEGQTLPLVRRPASRI